MILACYRSSHIKSTKLSFCLHLMEAELLVHVYEFMKLQS